jgi:hypothetical protein
MKGSDLFEATLQHFQQLRGEADNKKLRPLFPLKENKSSISEMKGNFVTYTAVSVRVSCMSLARVSFIQQKH